MGANRKLQQDIDRTLKKVQEGIDTFDQIWEKVYDADIALPLKEKFEADLKKEIKKLQRHRDQIKTWISSSDIKDKSQLTTARKDVERQMERFKVCEKETKTKAFSKEGLGQVAKMDPREKKRLDMHEWLSNTVLRLNEDLEGFDAEMETLGTGGGKKRGKPPPRIAHLEEAIGRHRTHVGRLEALMRLLDNEAMDPDEMEGVKELVDDYVERHEEAFDEFDTPEDLYESIAEHLDNLEATTQIKVNDPREKDKEKERERERERERDRERAAAAAAKLQLQQAGHKCALVLLKVEDELAEKPLPSARKEKDKDKEKEKEKGKERDKDKPAQNGPPSEAGSAKEPPSPKAPPVVQAPSAPAASAPLPIPEPSKPRVNAVQPSAASVPAPAGSWATPPISHVKTEVAKAETPPVAPSTPTTAPPQQPPPPPPPPQTIAPSPFASPAARAQEPFAHQSQGGASSSGPASTHGSLLGEEEPTRPSGLGKEPERSSEQAGASEPSAPLGPEQDALLTSQQHSTLLSAALERSMPVPSLDSQWPAHPPRLRGVPPGSMPDSYPRQRLPVLDNPALYERLDTEALFWAFYYQPGSFQQHLAARELKRQFWRYHKHHGAWFQRHEEPKKSTDEYEMGTYVYFDHHIQADEKQSGWCYRLKQDFVFKYDALEDPSDS